ncbi:MAG: enoyl-CoA hydratase/isomerase family protein [Thermodesulfobacteriota bacterium]|nr:enoyl-CoA hydratase/isomerase family protein [Thermodesulfobacteriota bacterium]
MSDFSTIIYEKSDSIAYITLNRPRALNVYNIQMRDELYQVLDAIKEDCEVRVAILKGAGEKAFCAGADLKDFLLSPSPIIARQVRWERDIWGLFLSIPQPLIAAVHGYVLGSGIEMALCCDIRIATDDSRFGLPEVGLGIIPAAGGTQTLPRVIGYGKALEMLLTDPWINAEQAYQVGLINEVVRREKLLERAKALAGQIASFDQLAVRCAKQAVHRGLDIALDQGLELEKRLARKVASVASHGSCKD